MNLPPELSTAVLAAVPITELRVSIPIALGVYKMSVFQAIWWSLIGSGIAAYLLLAILGPITGWLMKISPFLKRVIEAIFNRTRSKAMANYVKYGQWALILFVAVPLPGSGFWTGALIAFLFGLNKFYAWLLILAGLALSAALVVLISLGFINIF
jgi:uncharacterized membrane protein